jgi:3-methylfumaryl-CoA hydratase
MWQEWIGREEAADDEVTVAASRRLAALLDQPAHGIRRGGTVPAHWYVMLFTPTAPQSALGADGHPAKGQFLPPIDLPRRMFAGRRSWFHTPLGVGDEVKRISRIQAITPKTGRSGDMVFVTVRHELSAPGGLAVVEEQDIVYRTELPAGAAKLAAKAQAVVVEAQKAEWSRSFEPTPAALFRYSAITFNAHRIHYDLPYAQATEGYPGLVVNGGLTTLMLWDLVTSSTGRALTSSSSKNLLPLFVGQPVTLNACVTGENLVTAWVTDANGQRAVEAQLELDA